MRVILAVAGAAVALSLSGCDMRGGDQKPAKVDCNCTTTPPPAQATTPPPDMRGSTAYVPPEEHRTYHHHSYRPRGADGGHHGYYTWRKEYSEISVATYDYHSGSTSTYTGGGSYDGGDAYHGGGDYHGGHGEHDGGGYHGGHDGGYHDADRGWIDGYGRGHGGYTGDAVHYESGTDDGRGHVWHGYDADCPDDPHHR
jgi:hypothetical protein